MMSRTTALTGASLWASTAISALKGNLSLAEVHYKRALEQQQHKPELFQNYGAC